MPTLDSLSGIDLLEAPKARRRNLAVLYNVFGDESSDEDQERVFAVAGIIGNDSEWAPAVENWTKRTGGLIFHAKDCETDWKDFAQYSHQENLDLYRDLTRILAASGLMGYGCAMSLEDHDKLFAPMMRNNAYYFCFRNVVLHMAKAAKTMIPRATELEFTFDRNAAIEGNAAKVYDFVVNMPGTDFSDYFMFADKVIFATRKTPQVQMADLLARETMKRFDNEFGPKKRDMRHSFRALQQTRRFSFEWYGKEHFEELIRQANELAKARGHSTLLQKYNEWRTAHKNPPDTFEVRIRYTMSVLQEMPEENPFR
jgi:hypothetical protein